MHRHAQIGGAHPSTLARPYRHTPTHWYVQTGTDPYTTHIDTHTLSHSLNTKSTHKPRPLREGTRRYSVLGQVECPRTCETQHFRSFLLQFDVLSAVQPFFEQIVGRLPPAHAFVGQVAAFGVFFVDFLKGQRRL